MRFLHTGDLGDIIAALPSIRQLGGGHLVVTAPQGTNQCRESLQGARFEALCPLIEAQPYIESCTWEDDPKEIDLNLANFRSLPERRRENLADWQGRHLCITSLDLTPWLTVQPSSETKGGGVFARSTRYQELSFNWRVAARTVDKAIFVGLPSEYEEFGRKTYLDVPYRPTKDLLEVAELIAGCQLFVGNQSCPCWIAMGLGVNLIQEVWPGGQNSIVRRPNARFLLGYQEI